MVINIVLQYSPMGLSADSFIRVLKHPKEVFDSFTGKGDWKTASLIYLVVLSASAVSAYFTPSYGIISNLIPSGWFFPAIFIFSAVSSLMTVCFLHLSSRIFGGDGSFEDVFQCKAVAAVPLTAVSIVIGLLSNVSIFLSFLSYPIVFVALYFDYLIVRSAHSLGSGKSIAAVATSFAASSLIMGGVIFMLLFGAVISGLSSSSPNTVSESNGGLVYSNVESGYVIAFPPGWGQTENGTMMGMRLFSREPQVGNSSSLVFLVMEGFMKGAAVSQYGGSFSQEVCSRTNPDSIFRDYGNAKGCETLSTKKDKAVGTISFIGRVCSGNEMFIFSYPLSSDESEEYHALMSGISCSGTH
ncbi:MAG: Yip1 family protein [Candidatus Altiarchaeota archaeon]